MPLMAPRKPGTEPVYLRLSKKLHRAMRAWAKDNRREFSEEVSIALEAYLEKVGRWPLPEDDTIQEENNSPPEKNTPRGKRKRR